MKKIILAAAAAVGAFILFRKKQQQAAMGTRGPGIDAPLLRYDGSDAAQSEFFTQSATHTGKAYDVSKFGPSRV